MNRIPDVELVLSEYFADDGASAPDYVLDVVEGRISRQPQRGAWPFPGRTTVSNQVKLIAGLAAALVVAVAGWQLLPGFGNTGGQPTSTPAVTAVPSPTPVAIHDVPDAGGILDPGRWRFRPLEDAPNLGAVADVPAGWRSLGFGLEHVVSTNSPPAGLAIVFGTSEHGLYGDPCRWDLDGSGTWDQEGDIEVGPAVADLVDALVAHRSYASSSPRPISFGPYEGQQVEIRLPADVDPASCDAEAGEPVSEGRYRVMPDSIYSQGPGNIWRLFIVDVAGTRFVTIIEYFPGTAPDKLAEAQAIVESLEFTP